MDDNEIDAICGRVADLQPKEQVDVLVRMLEKVGDERDRLRAALRLIAIPPIHVPDVSEGCEACARTARRALDGEDFSELADQLDESAEATDE